MKFLTFKTLTEISIREFCFTCLVLLASLRASVFSAVKHEHRSPFFVNHHSQLETCEKAAKSMRREWLWCKSRNTTCKSRKSEKVVIVERAVKLKVR